MDVVEFLHDVLKVDHVPGKFPHVVSVHNSCHGVRELGLSSPSERHIKPFNKIIDLLNMVEGITIHEPERKDECCGFGGMFSIEEPAVSRMVRIRSSARVAADCRICYRISSSPSPDARGGIAKRRRCRSSLYVLFKF